MKETQVPHQGTISRLKGTIAGLQLVFKAKLTQPITVLGTTYDVNAVVTKLQGYDQTLSGVGTAKTNYQKVAQDARPVLKDAQAFLLNLGDAIKQILADPNLVAQCGFKVTTRKPPTKNPATIAKGSAAAAQVAEGKAAAKATRKSKSGKALVDLGTGDVEILPDAGTSAPAAQTDSSTSSAPATAAVTPPKTP